LFNLETAQTIFPKLITFENKKQKLKENIETGLFNCFYHALINTISHNPHDSSSNWYPKTNNYSYHIVMHNENKNEYDGDDR